MPVRVAAAVAAAAAVVAGVWVAGGLLTDDAAAARVTTAAWFVLATAGAVAVGLRWRPLGVPVVTATVLTAATVGGTLLWTSTVDRVVVEDVLVAAPPAPPARSGTPRPTRAAPAEPVLIGRGAFRSGEHATTGTATLLRRSDGSAVVTLTGLDTSPGPDLRVRLTRPGGAVDAGALRGNRGTQQYAVPPAVDPATVTAVVIWCRAFSVAFGTAALTAA